MPAYISERLLQQQIFNYLQWALDGNALPFHVPMGGSRDPREARNLKKIGAVAGIPDLAILYSGRAFFIEIKTGKGELSASQKYMIPRIWQTGCPVRVCRSLEEVIEFLNYHNVPLRSESVTDERIRRGFLSAMAEGGK